MIIAAAVFLFGICGLEWKKVHAQQKAADSLLLPEEQKHLKNARQLTFGGQNAEA